MNGIVDDIVENYNAQSKETETTQQEYRSFQDADFFKQNQFLSADELKITVMLYIDEFEVCNPLGTSKKKIQY